MDTRNEDLVKVDGMDSEARLSSVKLSRKAPSGGLLVFVVKQGGVWAGGGLFTSIINIASLFYPKESFECNV